MTSQAIEAAIELNLNTVEAGAQGEHKIQRGYMPVRTYSCHYLMDEGFRKAIEGFLVRESTQVIAFLFQYLVGILNYNPFSVELFVTPIYLCCNVHPELSRQCHLNPPDYFVS